jgi:hypothetical protein
MSDCRTVWLQDGQTSPRPPTSLTEASKPQLAQKRWPDFIAAPQRRHRVPIGESKEENAGIFLGSCRYPLACEAICPNLRDETSGPATLEIERLLPLFRKYPNAKHPMIVTTKNPREMTLSTIPVTVRMMMLAILLICCTLQSCHHQSELLHCGRPVSSEFSCLCSGFKTLGPCART